MAFLGPSRLGRTNKLDKKIISYFYLNREMEIGFINFSTCGSVISFGGG